MVNVFQSETKIVEVILKDSEGVVIDPTLETIHDIEIILTNKMDGSVVQKFSRESKTGFTQAVTSSTNMLCHVSGISDATKGLIEAQVNIITPDSNQPSGYSTHTQKGLIFNISEAWQTTE